MINTEDAKSDLRGHLRAVRGNLLWKLEGLGEYDVRRPMTPTGTNLLGLIKHLTTVELLYFGFAFRRPITDPPPWFSEEAEPNSDLWVTAEESGAYILDHYRRACALADATIDELDLDSVGHVIWLGGDVTLQQMILHVTSEATRHCGHADIVRELIDGAAGLMAGNDLLIPGDSAGQTRDAAWWAGYCEQIESEARRVEGR